MKKLVKDFTIGELREICDSVSGIDCECRCPLLHVNLCRIADNEIKRDLYKEIEVEE